MLVCWFVWSYVCVCWAGQAEEEEAYTICVWLSVGHHAGDLHGGDLDPVHHHDGDRGHRNDRAGPDHALGLDGHDQLLPRTVADP